jgi:hypothetical protein
VKCANINALAKEQKQGIPYTVIWVTKVLKSFCVPWRLNLHTKSGLEEKRGCGVVAFAQNTYTVVFKIANKFSVTQRQKNYMVNWE